MKMRPQRPRLIHDIERRMLLPLAAAALAAPPLRSAQADSSIPLSPFTDAKNGAFCPLARPGHQPPTRPRFWQASPLVFRWAGSQAKARFRGAGPSSLRPIPRTPTSIVSLHTPPSVETTAHLGGAATAARCKAYALEEHLAALAALVPSTTWPRP